MHVVVVVVAISQVRYHKDIRPVEAEYQRYKEVKALIQARTSAAAQ